MKLLVAAAVLAACAFAAPTTFVENDVIIPETTMVQLSDSVAELKARFKTMQMQVKSGMEVTPGVKKTVDEMVTMCDEDIFPAIKEAHAADQSDLNTMMGSVQAENDAWDEKEVILKQDGNDVRDLIDQEQAKSKKWEDAAALFTKTENNYLSVHDDQTDTCCKRDNAAVLDVEYVPAYTSCDYKHQDTSGDCANVARKDVSDVVKNPFDSGLSLYRSLRKQCASQTEDLQAADADTHDKIDSCQQKKIAADDASKLAASEQKRMQGDWDNAVDAYNKKYSELISDYDDREATVKTDEKDRIDEWEAVEIIKCMLINYKEGGEFDEEAEQKCKDSIDTTGIIDIGYPTRVPQKNPVLAPFEDQADDSAYQNTCNARAPASAFSCTVAEGRAVPECTHAQPQAPSSQYSSGPWDSEVEGHDWSIASGSHV